MTRTGVPTRFLLLVLAGLAVVGGPAAGTGPDRAPAAQVVTVPVGGR